MASRAHPGARLARISATGWRLLFLAILAVAFARTWMGHRYLAGVAIVPIAILVVFDLWRLLKPEVATGDGAVEAAVLRAPSQLEAALALIDTVTVALFVSGPDGRIGFMNRAARRLAGCEAGRLQDLAILGEDGAAAILNLPVGGRRLIAGEQGRSLLAWVGSIRHGEGHPQRLVSLQAVAGELDAVQVGAWHAMTRVLAHEMMNSLTPIASMAESVESLAAATDQDPRIAAAVATIGRRSRHLMDFVERYRAIVDLPRPVFEDIGVGDFLHDMDRLVGPDLRNRGIRFDTGLSCDGSARFDPALVEQAIINLVKNAAEAVETIAEPVIGLAAIWDMDALVIQVSDNGRGIEDDLLEEIFVPFFTTKLGGAGIGLALARQIALTHGGGLTACRARPSGSIFELRLPRQREALPPQTIRL